MDGFPGVEPMGLPIGRFFFMILPDQNEEQYNQIFQPKRMREPLAIFSWVFHTFGGVEGKEVG